MKKIMLLSLLLSFSFTGCKGQETTEKEAQKKDSITPEVNVSVQKQYDENGNLISVDSTYSYFYSNRKNDSLFEKDMYQLFRQRFDTQFGTMDSLFFKDFFAEDPFQMSDFYTDDFFENQFRLQQDHMQDLMQKMDSLKNEFYQNRNRLDSEMGKRKME